MVFAVLVTTYATVFATHTLLHNALHLHISAIKISPLTPRQSPYHSFTVFTHWSANKCVLSKLVSKLSPQIRVCTLEVGEEFIIADEPITATKSQSSICADVKQATYSS